MRSICSQFKTQRDNTKKMKKCQSCSKVFSKLKKMILYQKEKKNKYKITFVVIKKLFIQ